MTDRTSAPDRRELLRNTLRGITFGVLAAGAGFLAVRNGRDDCRLTLPCTSCDLRDGCKLERRRESRRTKR